jgi:hypothetical protein
MAHKGFFDSFAIFENLIGELDTFPYPEHIGSLTWAGSSSIPPFAVFSHTGFQSIVQPPRH